MAALRTQDAMAGGVGVRAAAVLGAGDGILVGVKEGVSVVGQDDRETVFVIDPKVGETGKVWSVRE